MKSQSKALVSVITIVYNGEKEIENTIQSVINQKNVDIEYIVIDGKSTDNTVNIIKQYSKYIAKYISESDKGIYDAMNKGIGLATGQWLFFLNAGDVFCCDNSLASLVDVTYDNNDYDIFSGKVRIVDTQGNFLNSYHPLVKGSENTLKYENCVAHQACLIKKGVIDKFGGFDDSYRIQGDYELWVKLLSNGCRFKFLDLVISDFNNDGISSNPKYSLISRHEALAIQKKYYLINQKKYIFLYTTSHLKDRVKKKLGTKAVERYRILYALVSKKHW